MSVPGAQGQYGWAEIYAKSGRALYYTFSIPDGSGVSTNVQAYAALRLNVADSQQNVMVTLNTNAGGIVNVNANHVIINATSAQMNVSPAVYVFDLDGLSSLGWQPVATVRFRIDR